ncbi:LRR receptor-like serine/threonine-protein kinase EFR [Magnolia sinica]|uniref:LRR receptor-like serine/threonine-protein kinase EFR n=1 Tax=Magnolia sinica TaxID=86752 RepID=UPI00265A74BE|nr:LRR receptor-like serine/threonine-protein kinase EFR [Magnolia sinica]
MAVVAAAFSNETDQFALLAFKGQITNDPLQALSSWNDSLHFCKWQGVKCIRRHERVVALNISQMDLKGLLAPHIANLTFLRHINLRGNKFHGSIPQDIGWGIPINITQCSELRRINVGRNSIVGEIPVELSSLPKLTILYLHSNKLVGSIPPFGNISSLTKLWLNQNSLHGSIPVDLCQIPNLKVLQVSENKLSGIITSQLYNLLSMRTFNVMNNLFSGRIPPDIGLTLPNLENLYMAGNQFTGPIPRSLGNASRLEILDLPDNKFINLKGGLPESVANLLTQLAIITMSKNQIFGSIPNGIGNLVSLTELAIDQNLMTGSIPVSIGKLQRLQILDLSRNRFSGSSPYSNGNISLQSELYLC